MAAFLIGRHIGLSQAPEGAVTVQVDTLTVHDTICVTEPVIVDRIVRDTMLVEVTDYVVVHDTAYVSLPREYVTYQDSLYRAVVSGFIPRLDEITVYPTEKIVTIQTEKTVTVPKRTHWGLGVQAGYGVSSRGELSPYLGVGVSYNILSW